MPSFMPTPKDEHEEILFDVVHKFNQFAHVLDVRNQGRKGRGEHPLRFDPYRGQGEVLRTVKEQENLTQAELAKTLGVRRQTLSAAVQKLEKNGLVERWQDPQDKRFIHVSITEKGLQACEALEEKSHYSSSVFEALTEEEMVAASAIFEKLYDHLVTEIEVAQKAEELISGSSENVEPAAPNAQ